MTSGIKKKVLLVLVAVLALSAALEAGLASYYTDRQNEQSAFTALSRDLQTWQKDLQAMTGHLQRVALSAGAENVLLDQLAELVTIELNADDPLRADNMKEAARTLSYSKAVSLNRLRLVLQSGGFSSIAVYTGNKLSHYISDTEAGMLVRRNHAPPVWIRTRVDATENANFQNWPAWPQDRPPPTIAQAIGDIRQPEVSVTFPSPEFAAIEIVVPLQGIVDEDWLPLQTQVVSRLVSELTLAEPANNQDTGFFTAKWKPTTLAVLVFRKRIDQAALGELAAKTDKWPALYSPDGHRQLRLTRANPLPGNLLQKAQTAQPGERPQVIVQTVTTEQGSFYEALLPWQFDHRTRLILGLTSSRDSTLQNIRETVTAVLIAASLILILSIGVGTYWMGRFIDPIVALTRAVKRIGIQRHADEHAVSGHGITAETLQPIFIEAPDEIGELGSAFNVMIAELRNAIETLEQRVQLRTAEVRQQTSYLRTLIDTLPLSVWIKDTECRYLATNQANADACGRTVEGMVGKSDQELWPHELAAHYCAEDTEVMKSKQRKMVEEPIAGPNGMAWMEIYRAPALDEDGTVLGTVGAARDISERKAAEAAREAALAEAVRLARHRSEFLAQMSHELRTPLNAILGYAQILRRDQQHLTDRQAAGLATIQESGQHLLNLINDILDLARVEAGKLVMYPAETALAPFLKVVVDIIRVKAEEKDVLFSYHGAQDMPDIVTVDNRRLRQVLLNLLGNAVKFTDHGEVALRILKLPSPATEPDRSDDMVRLRFEIEDSGVGMSDEQLSRIFQPFEQVGDMQRREGGTGLGLAISQQLVRRMGGSIQVVSKPGEGSRFWFDLDLPVAAALPAPTLQQQIMVGYQGPRRKLLIVDDVPQNRIMLMDATLPLGFDVADAANGRQCLDLLGSVKPDLILMDVMMPVMDGYEATRRIRALPAFSHVPIVIVTASATRADEAKGIAAGASAFITKPIEQDALLQIVGEQLSLTWIYETPSPETADESEEAAVGAVTPPPEEIEKLYQIARLGNMQNIIAQADLVKRLDPRYVHFARHLQSLAENYQSKAVVALLEKYRMKQES